jgi:hypothetical protein
MRMTRRRAVAGLGARPSRRPGTRVVSGTLHSAAVPEPVGYAVGLPPGHAGAAAAVCLPGRGTDAEWVMNVLPSTVARATGTAAPTARIACGC